MDLIKLQKITRSTVAEPEQIFDYLLEEMHCGSLWNLITGFPYLFSALSEKSDPQSKNFGVSKKYNQMQTSLSKSLKKERG